jgi:hypothetical protein
LSEQADDALAGLHAVGQVPEIDAGHLGFLGVNQAGWIAPIAASHSPDVAFTVLASGPTVTTGEESFYSDLTGDADVTDESQRAELSQQLANHGPSGFDPKPFLTRQGVPGLWLFGSDDGSIPVPTCRSPTGQRMSSSPAASRSARSSWRTRSWGTSVWWRRPSSASPIRGGMSARSPASSPGRTSSRVS